MVNKRIQDESELIERISIDIRESDKQTIVIQAGHFPLIYKEGGAQEGIRHWGAFSPYSLEIACKAAQTVSEKKEIKFAFFVDDHSYESYGNISKGQASRMRGKLYRKRSDQETPINHEFMKILEAYGFGKENIITHNHGKKGREACNYFSEKVLRAAGRNIENICAKEYVAFIEDPDYFDKPNSHLVSFVPNRCKGHICNVALDEEIEGISSSHIFMETMMPLATPEELYTTGRGITYRRDTPDEETNL